MPLKPAPAVLPVQRRHVPFKVICVQWPLGVPRRQRRGSVLYRSVHLFHTGLHPCNCVLSRCHPRQLSVFSDKSALLSCISIKPPQFGTNTYILPSLAHLMIFSVCRLTMAIRWLIMTIRWFLLSTDGPWPFDVFMIYRRTMAIRWFLLSTD
ncbi:hypothetical protein CEXT_162801 [Caerostris extrusa]|uniref:Uncharacterized protein n=1 Tax=Caerostris extrusa TaxID=172846 RepID=A0AAV4QPH6_CAEEX|nr:hypothetical protein CEXT_162801 [Caerostris extrusa]